MSDTTTLPDLLEQIDEYGAYDGDPINTLLEWYFGFCVKIIIPPPNNAVLGPTADHDPPLQDQHIAAIRTGGQMAWNISSRYNLRCRGETQMGRWKMVKGPKLKAWSFLTHKTNARIGAPILNKMTEL